MTMLDEISTETAKDGESEGYMLDPLTLLLIASAISTIIRLYMECKKKEDDVVVACQNMASESEKMVYKVVRQKMGLLKFTFGGGARIARKIIARAKRIKNHEMVALYKEVGEI